MYYSLLGYKKSKMVKKLVIKNIGINNFEFKKKVRKRKTFIEDLKFRI